MPANGSRYCEGAGMAGDYVVADHYNPIHQPYWGVLGTWPVARAVGGYPTDEEIAAAAAWLRGEAVHVHDD